MMKINLHKITKKLINYYPFIVFTFIIFFVSRNFFFKNGYVIFGELPASTNYFFFLKDFLKSWSDISILGRSNIGFPTTYGLNQAFMVTPPMPNLIWFSFMFLLQFIFGSLWSVKVYILLALLLPFISMYYFAKFWFKEFEKKSFLFNTIAFVSGLIYSINSMVGDRIFAGHLFYNFGYGIFPLFLLLVFKSVEARDVRERTKFILFAGLISSILVWLMPHLFIIILIPLSLYFLLFLFPDINKIKIFLINGILTALIGLISNIYLWLPALFYSETYPYFKNSVHILSYLYNVAPFVTFGKVLTLSGGAEQLFLTKEKYVNLFLLRLFLPFLAIIGLILIKDRRKSLFAFLLVVFGIVFGMGVNFPFENMYKYLYQHFFLFSPFRDTSKFIILYIFGLSLTIPVIFIYLDKVLKKAFWPTVVLFTIYILFINPVFTSGDFGKNIIPFQYPKKYDVLQQFLQQQKDNFRVAVYPNDKYVGEYDWFPKSPNGSIHPTLFSFFLPLSKSLALSNRTISNYSSRYLDYLETNLNYPWAVNRLGQEMVKYIIVDPSMKGYERDLERLRSNPAVSEINMVDGFYIFEAKKNSPEIIKQRPAVYYFGDIKGIKNLPSDLALINLGLNSTTGILSKNYSNNVILYDTSLEDILYTSLSKFNFSFFPQVRFPKDAAKEFYIPGEYLRDLTLKGISFYNPEIIATTGKNNIKKISNLKNGKYKILLSSLSDENFTNAIKIKIDNTSIIRTNFRKKNDTFEWVDFGEIEIKNDKPMITVENLEDNSFYLDNLLIIAVDQYKTLQEDFYSKIKSKKIISLKESESLNINSLKQNQKPVYVFSQSFSPYWKICDSPVFRVNFFGTGVACDKKTNLNPQFIPEKLYKASLILSLIFYLSIILVIIKLAKKNDQTN